MTAEEKAKRQVSSILASNKETEFLQSFVRIEISEEEAESTRRRRQRREPSPTLDDAPPHPHPPPPPPATKPLTGKAIFKQIRQEMKNRTEQSGKRRRNRRGGRDEEVYTDKDRAAAVNMGYRDIKQSLHAKMKRDRTQALALPEEADPSTLLALGRNELRGGNLHAAMSFVDKALELNPGEKNALVARSRCHLLLGEPRLALRDAETALSLDPTFVRAVYQKAEALYFLGDFELSLVFYHRGLRARPELEGFRLGIQKAQEAIENTVGGAGPLNRPTPPPPPSRGRPPRPPLGRLHLDKRYLESLLENPDLRLAECDGGAIAHAEEAVRFLERRQEFWTQQRPAAGKDYKFKIQKIK